MRHNVATSSTEVFDKRSRNINFLHHEEYWKECKVYLQKRMPASLFQCFIEPIQTHHSQPSRSPDFLHLISPTRQIASRFSERYLPMIQSFLHTTPLKGQVRISIRDKTNQLPSTEKNTAFSCPEKRDTEKNLPAKKGDKEDFVPDDLSKCQYFREKNVLIPKMSRIDVQNLWESRNMLAFISGREGSGKTSILTAIAESRQRIGLKSSLISLERFMTELALASQNRDSMSWRKKLRSYDFIAIDNFQYIKPRALRSQEELVYLIDDFLVQGKTLIFCSDKLTDELPLIAPLLSRLQSAHLIQLTRPDMEERKTILRRECILQKITVSQEIIEYLSRIISGDMRRLKTSVLRIRQYQTNYPCSMAKLSSKDSLLLIDSLCRDLCVSPSTASPRDVLSRVAEFFGISPAAIKGPSRDKKCALARHLTAYFCVTYLRMNLKETALLVGRREHGSVIHARKKIENLIQNDLFFRKQVQKLCLELDLDAY